VMISNSMIVMLVLLFVPIEFSSVYLEVVFLNYVVLIFIIFPVNVIFLEFPVMIQEV